MLLYLFHSTFPIHMNLAPVFIAAISGFAIGFVWHGPLFGKTWMSLMKFTEADIEAAKKRGMAKIMIMGFIAQVVTAFILRAYIAGWNVTTIGGALEITTWTWLGFIVTTQLNGVLWEGRSVKLYLFNISYYFVQMAFMAISIALWK
jgi:Protein of unknown function (DUF1761)